MEWWLLTAGLLTGFCGGWIFHPTVQECTHMWVDRFTTLCCEEGETNPQGSRVLARQRALERLIAEMREEAFGVSATRDDC